MLKDFPRPKIFRLTFMVGPAKLSSNAQTKKLLKKFARRAYRGAQSTRRRVFGSESHG